VSSNNPHLKTKLNFRSHQGGYGRKIGRSSDYETGLRRDVHDAEHGSLRHVIISRTSE
jgi:hypothetical protein